MIGILSQRKFHIGVVVFILLIVIVFNIGGIFTPVRGAFWSVGQLIAVPVRSAIVQMRQVSTILFSLSDYRESQRDLYEENRRLEARVAELESCTQENVVLREELSLQNETRVELITALIVGYSDPGAGEWITVNKGSSSGIATGMPVFAHASVLIGNVEEVSSSTSRIRLLTSGDNVVNVRIANTRVKGVVRGRFGLGLQLDMILSTDPLTEGDRVVTSEIGQRFPKDLYVGTIRDVRMSEDGLSRQAVVDQEVSLYDLEMVSVGINL